MTFTLMVFRLMVFGASASPCHRFLPLPESARCLSAPVAPNSKDSAVKHDRRHSISAILTEDILQRISHAQSRFFLLGKSVKFATNNRRKEPCFGDPGPSRLEPGLGFQSMHSRRITGISTGGWKSWVTLGGKLVLVLRTQPSTGTDCALRNSRTVRSVSSDENRLTNRLPLGRRTAICRTPARMRHLADSWASDCSASWPGFSHVEQSIMQSKTCLGFTQFLLQNGARRGQGSALCAALKLTRCCEPYHVMPHILSTWPPTIRPAAFKIGSQPTVSLPKKDAVRNLLSMIEAQRRRLLNSLEADQSMSHPSPGPARGSGPILGGGCVSAAS